MSANNLAVGELGSYAGFIRERWFLWHGQPNGRRLLLLVLSTPPGGRGVDPELPKANQQDPSSGPAAEYACMRQQLLARDEGAVSGAGAGAAAEEQEWPHCKHLPDNDYFTNVLTSIRNKQVEVLFEPEDTKAEFSKEVHLQVMVDGELLPGKVRASSWDGWGPGYGRRVWASHSNAWCPFSP